MRALITGATGQDGTYLTELLLNKGYIVHGIVRRTSFQSDHIRYLEGATLHCGDMTDTASLERIIRDVHPHEIYNLAAQSHVGASFDTALSTTDINGLGPIRILEIIRNLDPTIRFYQASTSEMFGKVQETPQTEKTPLYPRSPYGVAKTMAHHAVINYRETYNLFACSGILFNHESERRGYDFVTQKIARGAANIKNGVDDELVLGNLEAMRDWGYAQDYVKAMWLMLQQEKPDDFVIATGKNHSVEEFVNEAFSYVGLDPKKYVRSDPKLYRPLEVNTLLGDASKAKQELGWQPSTSFKEIVRKMVDRWL